MLKVITKAQRALRAAGAPPRAPVDRPPTTDLAAKPDPLDRLRGPRRTAQGTLVWSDPTAPPLELFDAAIPLAEVDACLVSIREWNETAERYKFKTLKSQVWSYTGWRREAQPETDEDLIAAHDAEADASKEGPPPDPRPECKCFTCEDSGAVAPDAFGDREPWPRWIERTGGNPLIHPLPCPACRPAESAAARERLRNR
jgi:hypothetical protein